MTNYLFLIQKNHCSFDAQIFSREDNPTFDTMVSITSALPEITSFRDFSTSTETKGIIKAEEITSGSDLDALIRSFGFRKCDICNSWVSPQDVRNGNSVYDGSKRYCKTCWNIKENSDTNKEITLSSYHGTSDSVRVINSDGETFDLTNVLGVGIEMEYNSRSIRNGYKLKCNNDFYKIANSRSRNRIFRCEEDATVAGEIISNVFTKKALYAFDWNILTDTLKLNGNDENIANVGFHVHLSKSWLGDNESTQAINFLKLQYFLKSYEEDFFKMSGRKRDEMQWCSFYTLSDIESMKSDIVACNNNHNNPWRSIPCSHSYALISSGKTIELRIGKSTNDPVKIDNYLKLVLGIVENIKNVPFEKCYCLGRVTKLVPNEVMNYWRKNGCFLNTNAMDKRGETL